MAFKKVSTDATKDIKTEKGKPYQGIYIGNKQITTEIGEQTIYRFRNDNKVFGVYGFTNLNRAMDDICEGTMVRLTYTGTENVKTKFGMKDVHQVDVEIDEDASVAPDRGDEKL